jgi:hypothetical protein
VAIGFCEGLSVDSLGQQQVRVSLGDLGAQHGFDTGQEVQHSLAQAKRVLDIARSTELAPFQAERTSTLAEHLGIAAAAPDHPWTQLAAQRAEDRESRLRQNSQTRFSGKIDASDS